MKKMLKISTFALVLLLVVAFAGSALALEIGSITDPATPAGVAYVEWYLMYNGSAPINLEQCKALIGHTDENELKVQPVSIIGTYWAELVIVGDEDGDGWIGNTNYWARALKEGVTDVKTINAGYPYARVWAIHIYDDNYFVNGDEKAVVAGCADADATGYASIAITFKDSMSPVVFVRMLAPRNEFGEFIPWDSKPGAPAADPTKAADGKTANTGKAPYTGENMMLVAVACAAILCGGVVACVSFKKKA